LVPFVIDWGDARHPTQAPSNAEDVCELKSFSAEHPAPSSITADLDALGCALQIKEANEPKLRAVLTGPNGSLSLS
jgi:hypothetical protein